MEKVRRVTKQRKLILDAIKSTKTHPTADDVYQKLKTDHPEISLGTVYRNISVLCESGDIVKVEGCFSSERFDGNNQPHYHFVCSECKRLFDLPVEYFSDIDERINNSCCHKILSHSILFDGICEDCLQAEKVK